MGRRTKSTDEYFHALFVNWIIGACLQTNWIIGACFITVQKKLKVKQKFKASPFRFHNRWPLPQAGKR